ncbi:MAG: hypothetical protein Q9181_008173, partial [Wetmoreana brouardii]
MESSMDQPMDPLPSTFTKRDSPIEAVSAYNSSIFGAKSIAIPFGRQEDPLEFSEARLPHIRRQASSSLTYRTAVCKGRELYQRMKDQYARYAADPKNNQGKEYGGSDIENGWSKNTIPL